MVIKKFWEFVFIAVYNNNDVEKAINIRYHKILQINRIIVSLNKYIKELSNEA